MQRKADGAVVRDVKAVKDGEVLLTRLAEGAIRSRAELKRE
jgi:hypothetical protein